MVNSRNGSATQRSTLARLAAQHDEITRLRDGAGGSGRVTRLASRTATIGPCS